MQCKHELHWITFNIGLFLSKTIGPLRVEQNGIDLPQQLTFDFNLYRQGSEDSEQDFRRDK